MGVYQEKDSQVVCRFTSGAFSIDESFSEFVVILLFLVQTGR